MFRKTLAVLLCAVMCLSPLGVLSALAEEPSGHCDCGKTPVVYVKGRTTIYKDPEDNSPEGKAETNLSGGAGSVAEAVAHVLPLLSLGLTTGRWGPYCDAMFEEIVPLYEGYALNDDGEVENGSGIWSRWQIDNNIALLRSRGANWHIRQAGWLMAQEFQYDMRLDPRENADYLNAYIEAVKEVTGHDKVDLVARCEGTVIANAYFNEYGYDSIESALIYNSIACGAEIADEMFSNHVTTTPEALNAFLNQYLDTTPLMEFLKAVVNAAAYNGTLKLGTDAVEYIYHKIAPDLMPRLIRAIFGTCPGWWGMVSPEHVEECKAFVLEGNPDGRYDKLIEKIDGYGAYKANARGILEEMAGNGVPVYVFAKYGNQMYPMVESLNELGDGVVSLYKQTFRGATTAGFETPLPEDYLAEREAAGFGAYLSADKQVDASTALLADHTWFLKNLPHDKYPDDLNPRLLKLLRYDGYATTETFEDTPRFILCHPEHSKDPSPPCTFEPLTAENAGVTTNTADTSSFLKVVRRLLDTMRTLLKTWLSDVAASLREKTGKTAGVSE